jgi:hypothetical protein
MKKIGRFHVGQGKDFGCRPENYEKWIVTDQMGMVQGHYDSEYLAEILATGLDKADRKKIDKEVDEILRR